MSGIEEVEKIGDFNVDKEIKYLGIWVGGKGRFFQDRKDVMD